MLYINTYGEYNPNQPRISRIADVIKNNREVKFIVSSGRGEGVIPVGGNSKASYILKSSRYLNKRISKDDIVLGYIHVGGLGPYLSRRTEFKFWYDYPDPWKGWYYYKSPEDSLKWKLGRKAFYFLEKKMAHSADYMTTASPAQLKFLRDQHGQIRQADIIYNCPDLKLFNRDNKDPSLKTKLGLEDYNILIHIGYIGAEYGADILVKSLAKIQENEKNTRLIFLGSSPTDKFGQYLGGLIRKHGLQKDVIFNRVPYEVVPHYLNIADIGCICFRDSFYNHLGGANKLFEYMATGIGIVSAEMSGFKLMVENEKNVLFFRPEDVDDFATKALQLLQDDNLRKKLGGNNIKLVKEKYNWDLETKKIYRILDYLDSI